MEPNRRENRGSLQNSRKTVKSLNDDSDIKHRVAREAATLLYLGAQKEYKQAKTKAAEIFGAHFLPSNLEVALELNKIAEENEGPKRKEHLIQMRKEALDVMRLLSVFYPVLIGSVWRGTIKQGSDIDIAVYTDEPEEITKILKAGGVRLLKTAWTTVNKREQHWSHSTFTPKPLLDMGLRSWLAVERKRERNGNAKPSATS